MRYSLMVQELKSVSDITNYKAGLVFGEVHPFLYVRQKWSAVHFLKYQIELVCLLEELDQLDDVSVSLAMIEYFDFAEHSRSVVSWDLVDNFDSVFLASVIVLALLHRGIRAFSQEFAGKGI